MIGRICVFATFPLLLGMTGEDEWKTFTSKDGGFQVLLLGKPLEAKQDVKTPSGNIEVTLFIVDVKGEGSYVVGFSELPDEAIKGGTVEKRDNARDGAVTSAKGKLKSEKKLTLNGFPGRDLFIESEKGNTVRTRFYAAKERLLQTAVVGNKAFVQDKDADRFLDSFKIIP